MAALAGFGGQVKVGAAVAANITDWSLDIDAELLDTTAFGSSWKTFIAGLKGWKGKISANFDQTDATGQIALQSAILGGTSVTLALYIDGTHNYSGTAFIQTESPKAAVSSTVGAEFSFLGTSTLTFA